MGFEASFRFRGSGLQGLEALHGFKIMGFGVGA